MPATKVRRKLNPAARLHAQREKREAAEAKKVGRKILDKPADKKPGKPKKEPTTKSTKATKVQKKSAFTFAVGDIVYGEGTGVCRIEKICPDRGWVQVRRVHQDGTPNDDFMGHSLRSLLMPESIGPVEMDEADVYRALPLCMPEPIEAHRLANLLPEMTAEERAALRADLREHGQLEDIILHEGLVLDGRHRQAELMDLGIIPRYAELPAGKDPLQYVYSKALHRNLDATQKACSAALIKGEFEAAAKARKGKKNPEAVPGALRGDARDLAGNLFGVSGRYVQEAITVLGKNRELFDAAFGGRMKLTQAVRQIKGDEQPKPAAGPILPPGGILDWSIEPRDCMEVLEGIKRKSAALVIAHPPHPLDPELTVEVRREIEPATVWVEACVDALRPGGAMWAIVSHHQACEVETALLAHGMEMAAWITWQGIRKAGTSDERFARVSLRLLYAIKPGDDPIFNRPEFGPLTGDVWDVPALRRTDVEYAGETSSQLPLAIVRPIVLGCSMPGELVVDPFCGAGTSAVAAVLAGRQFIGAEKIGPRAVRAVDRVQRCIDQATALSSAMEKEGGAR